MELRKRISRYKSVEVRTHDHTFQPHAVSPDAAVLQSSVGGKENGKLLDEVGCQFKHRQVASLVVRLDECRHMVSCTNPCHVSSFYTVSTHTLLKCGIVLVKRSEQCLILAADSLIGIAHHFRRNIRFTV